ncbi:hypothetical protein NAT47_09660 [Flavobacterium sp. HXWNR69]|uniref:Uncharacterized protein n=1 Tax=Flavobacterium fragile TaxID=2949085 RepID=A0ABT0TK02_9FLAO|nr:hypothetical protein [Flavobacterium sp. HXWNR69]MCL9770685.1 hypothetical protein [Flavobacterium sp. HXWNR69]
MTYLRFVQYFYLVFAGFFFYDALEKYNEGKHLNDILLSIAIAFVAIGMFFFRRHFQKKFQNRR